MKTTKNHKNWLSKELHSLINEKPRVFNEWKNYPNQELFKSYKELRNNVYRTLPNTPDDYTKHSRISHLQKKKGVFQKQINSIKQTEGHNVISD